MEGMPVVAKIIRDAEVEAALVKLVHLLHPDKHRFKRLYVRTWCACVVKEVGAMRTYVKVAQRNVRSSARATGLNVSQSAKGSR